MELDKLTLYISAWNWHILGVLSLFFSMLFFVIRINIASVIFYISLFLLFIVCEINAWKRKRKLEDEE